VLSPTVTRIPRFPRARTAASDLRQCPSVINTSEFITIIYETISKLVQDVLSPALPVYCCTQSVHLLDFLTLYEFIKV
jgi:hypothetical protein